MCSLVECGVFFANKVGRLCMLSMEWSDTNLLVLQMQMISELLERVQSPVEAIRVEAE